MTSKDCVRPVFTDRPQPAPQRRRAACFPGRCPGKHALLRRARGTAVVLVALLVPPAGALADGFQSVRLWPEAVVVQDEIRLGDLCELAGFDADSHQAIRDRVVAPAPPPGGSRLVSLEEVRGALVGAGLNMARTIVKGAVECGVRRPKLLPAASPAAAAPERETSRPPRADAASAVASRTLRDVVIDFFEQRLQRYGGRVRVDFGRTAGPALDLSGPEFDFAVRLRSGGALGMMGVIVDVCRDGRAVQQVEFLANVTLLRDVVIARRAINQKAEIGPTDLQVTELAFDNLDRLGLTDVSQAIGQRARRFVPAGTMLNPRDLETLPLVKRGQLVEVYSRVGATTVRTAAKAMESGALGELIELRSTERRGRMLLGRITGPRKVELRQQGRRSPGDRDTRLAVAGGDR